jgi:hypothetical protein
LEPESSRPGENGTGKEATRRVWNRKEADQESLEPEETVQGVLQKITKIEYGREI